MRTSLIIFSVLMTLISSRVLADDRRIESSPELVNVFKTLNQIFNDSSDPGHFRYDQDFDIVVVSKDSEYPVAINSSAILDRLKQIIDMTIELHNLSRDQKESLLNQKAIRDFRNILGNDQYLLYESYQPIPLGYNGYDVSHKYFVSEGYRLRFEMGFAD